MPCRSPEIGFWIQGVQFKCVIAVTDVLRDDIGEKRNELRSEKAMIIEERWESDGDVECRAFSCIVLQIGFES